MMGWQIKDSVGKSREEKDSLETIIAVVVGVLMGIAASLF